MRIPYFRRNERRPKIVCKTENHHPEVFLSQDEICETRAKDDLPPQDKRATPEQSVLSKVLTDV